MLLNVAENPSASQAYMSSNPQQHHGVLYQQLYMNIIDCLLSSTSVACDKLIYGTWRNSFELIRLIRCTLQGHCPLIRNICSLTKKSD